MPSKLPTFEEITRLLEEDPGMTERLLRHMLENPLWPSMIKPMEPAYRLHDDHDGTYEGVINVGFTHDGDAWITILGGIGGLRFRTPFGGGGTSPRTRTALMVLAMAMTLDNEARPQHGPPPRNKEAKE